MDTFQELQGLIIRYATTVHHSDELSEGLPLGSAGLGLDSVAILELLLECQKRFGIDPAKILAQHRTLTVGTLLAGIAEGKAT